MRSAAGQWTIVSMTALGDAGIDLDAADHVEFRQRPPELGIRDVRDCVGDRSSARPRLQVQS